MLSKHSSLRFGAVIGLVVLALAAVTSVWGAQTAVASFLVVNGLVYACTASPVLGAQANMLDIAKLNGNDAVVGLVEENLTFAPELEVVPARTVKGTSYRTVSRDTYPGVGFRAANGGVPYTKSTFLNRLHECYIFSGNIRADVAIASAHEDGADAFKAIEASGVAKQALIEIGQQFIYGLAADAKGFPGLKAFHDAFSTELTARGVAPIVIDAGGTTADTGSSVYGVKFGEQGLQFIFGNNAGLTLGEWFQQMVNDGNAGQDYLAWVNSLNAWIGLQAANPYCVGRLKDATADANKGVTDSLLEDLLALYPVGYKPDAWFMSRRSRRQLQKSRSVVLSSGTPQRSNAGNVGSGGTETSAPIPTEACGIPIVCTDSIVDTEALS